MTISFDPLHGSRRAMLVVAALLVAACGSGQGVATATPSTPSLAATPTLAPATPSASVASATAELPPVLCRWVIWRPA